MTARTHVMFIVLSFLLTPLFVSHPWMISLGLANTEVKIQNLIPPPAEETPEAENDDTPSLTEVIEKHLTGLNFETTSVQQTFRQNAKWYAQQRARGGAIQECTGRGPFCSLLHEPLKQQSTHRQRSLFTVLKSFHAQAKTRSWIESGDVGNLSSAPGSDVKGALRKITDLSLLGKLISHSLAATTCKSAQLNQLLAYKVEEFLPDPKNMRTAIQLYEKAVSCGNSGDLVRAKYRLSLLYIWNRQYASALPHLEYLASLPSMRDIQPRALFWKTQCQQKLGKTALLTQTKKTLTEKYPFSFHALLVQDSNSLRGLPQSLEPDSEILFRTKTNPKLNEKVEAAEALLDIRENLLAREVLDRLGPTVDQTEPEFRLYLGVLYSRLNFYLKNFQLLSSVFHDDPSLISKAAMELYYPKSPLQFYDLKKIEMDEKLLYSLIRQESGFNVKARSAVGARGLMQIMPSTAKRFEPIHRYEKLFDPALNLRIGSKYFNVLLQRYRGDAELALAAYNAGPKRVDQWLSRYPVRDRILFLDLIPFKETRDYVASIARNYFWYAALYPTPKQVATDDDGTRTLQASDHRWQQYYFSQEIEPRLTQKPQ